MNAKSGVLERIKAGDVVARNSYGCDIYFKVTGIYTGPDGKDYARLKGLDLRLEATAPLDDLVVVSPEAVAAHLQQCALDNFNKAANIIRRRDQERRANLDRALGAVAVESRQQ